MVRRLASAYFAGAVAALVSSLALWIAARAELIGLLGVSLAPSLDWAWLAPRLLWGSLWGLGYPLVRRHVPTPTRAGLALSLAPSAAQLFWFLPRAGRGMLGVSDGPLTPLVVLAANALWGWVVARVVMRTEGAP